MHGDELREHRLALGLSQAQLADMLGLTQQAIYCMEHGKAKITQRNATAIERIVKDAQNK